MRVWKRRAAMLMAFSVGTAGLMMSSAGAQTPPPTIPPFTFPSIPDFPSFPNFPPPPTQPPFTLPTIPPPPTMPPPTSPPSTPPPPTMPPPTSPPSTPPPPTMPPPSSPPPTSPPSTSPPVDFDEVIEDLLDDIGNSFEQGQAGFEQIQQIIDDIRGRFFS